MISETVDIVVGNAFAGESEEKDLNLLEDKLNEIFGYQIDLNRIEGKSAEEVSNLIYDDLIKIYDEKEKAVGDEVFRKIEIFPLPVIAVVNGFALGGGCELAMSCDFRVCSENAVFGQPEVGLGITPGFGGTQRLARLIGLGKAKEMIYTANAIKADEALNIGLVNHVYPQETLMEEAMKLAQKIAKNAPFAVRACKKAINQGIDTDMDRAIIIEEKLFGECFATEDQKIGMKAFLEKVKGVEFKNK